MSKPMATMGIRLQSIASMAMTELISTESSLNMEADLIRPGDWDYDPEVMDQQYRPVYLSESDRMVRHAMEHLHAGVAAVEIMRQLLERIKIEVLMSQFDGPIKPGTIEKFEREALDRYMQEMQEEATDGETGGAR